ncbi:MAG: UPF0280 family protein [Deltaproteobacteria bacterium]|nr:UPF0280 family protein [Deltaproteobacteria bacterium]
MRRQRHYRSWLAREGLVPFRVQVKETDLYILARTPLEQEAEEAIITFRHQLESYLTENPLFVESLVPLPLDPRAPEIVREMLTASQKAGVGPMAGVAGAMAEFVGKTLLSETPEVVVENGGDIFLQSSTERKIGIFADRSPLNMRVGIRVPPERTPVGICTSSGTVGHSTSFGKADAVCVISSSTALADAAATAVGNLVQGKGDIEQALEWGRTIPGVEGIVIIVADALGAWGGYELVKL